jgi:hypothetical protein
MMERMPAIPESTRSSITLRLLDHAEKNWPQLARYHGSFAYITGVLRNGEQIPLFRLRYGGSAHSFGFAIYSPARDRYEDAVLFHRTPHRQPPRSPRHRLHRPPRTAWARTRTLTPTNLRSQPLKRQPCGRRLITRIHPGHLARARFVEHPEFHAHLVVCDAASPGGSAVMRLPDPVPGPACV